MTAPLHHVVSAPAACPGCAAPCNRTFVARSRPDGLRFSSSLTCSSCGYAVETDSLQLDVDSRHAFLAAQGRWTAIVREPGARRLDVMRALRARLGTDLGATAEILCGKAAVVTGTLAEVEWAAAILRGVGADVEVARLADGDER